MKKSLKCTITVLLAFLIIASGMLYVMVYDQGIKAEAAYISEGITYAVDGYDMSAEVFRCSQTGSVSIPSSIYIKEYMRHYTVKGIYDGAFEGCTGITSISLPSTLLKIGKCAFGGCTGLTSITIPSGVTSIGSNAFYGCNRLVSIKVDSGNQYFTVDENGVLFDFNKTKLIRYPVGNTSESYTIPDSVISIENDAFSGCTGLSEVIIPDSVKSIGESAFLRCTKLSKVIIPDSVISIGGNAFRECKELSSVIIPDSVISIGYCAFEYCTKLTDITIPDSVTSIGNLAFSETSYYNDAKNWNNGVLYIGNHLIDAKDSLSGTYEIKKGTITISPYTFMDCRKLIGIIIPDSVVEIGVSAFYGCTGLKELTMPASAKTNNSFYNCGNIEKIIITKGSGKMQNYTNYESLNDYEYYRYSPWYISRCSDITIEEGVTSISEYAFYECTEIESIIIPDSVLSVGKMAFCGCSKLTEITLGENINSIDYRAFYGCDLTTINYNVRNWGGANNKSSEIFAISEKAVLNIGNKVTVIPSYVFAFSNLIEVNMGDGVRTIGEMAFCDTGITEITIPDSVTSIGKKAFNNCINLKKIYYNAANCGDFTYEREYENGKYVNKYVFFGCDKLDTVIFGNSVKYIPEMSFYSTGITSVRIPDCVTSAGMDAFSNCEKLTEVYVGNGLKTVSTKMFYECINLETVIIGDGTEGVASNAFDGCTNLKSVKLPSNLKSIGSRAFRNCNSLYYIEIPKSVVYIYDEAFAYCKSLTSITIPENVTYVGENVFLNCTAMTTVNYNAMNCNTMGSFDATVFEGCTSLKTINLGSKVNFVPDYAFASYLPVESVAIPSNIASIGSYSFAFFENLKNVVVPMGTMSIGDYAFGYCYDLEYVHLPSSITTIGVNAFKSIDDFYICANSLDCVAKSYSAENSIPFMLCTEPHDVHYHSYLSKEISAASCTFSGVINHHCSCGDSYIEGVPMFGHTLGGWETIVAATEQSEGKKVKKCIICGEVVETKILPVILMKTAKDTQTGIAIQFNANSFDGTVGIVASESQNLIVKNFVKESTGTSDFQIHNIAVTVDGVITDLEESITVKIPIPEGYLLENTNVYSVDVATGSIEKFLAKYQDGYLVFDTSDLNCIAIVNKANNGGSNQGDSDTDKSGLITIKKPSTTTVNYGDTLILHANASNLPEGCSIKWTVEGTGVKLSPSADGKTCSVTCTGGGTVSVKAAVVDVRGNVISDKDGNEASASQILTAKAGFFQKLISFFKNLFGVNRIISQALKNIF